MQDENRIFFVHLPSAGGTTLWSVFEKVYGPGGSLRLFRDKREAFEAETARGERPDYSGQNVIGGHIRLREAARGAPDRERITFLRDPAARALSQYHRKVRNGKRTPVSDDVLEDMMAVSPEGRGPGECTGYFHPDSRDAKGDPESIAAEVIASLRENFAFVGIVEQFNMSLHLMAERFGWSEVPLFERRNHRGGKSGGIDPELRALLEERRPVECAVYRAMLDDFAERWQASAPGRDPTLLQRYEAALADHQDEFVAARDGVDPFRRP